MIRVGDKLRPAECDVKPTADFFGSQRNRLPTFGRIQLKWCELVFYVERLKIVELHMISAKFPQDFYRISGSNKLRKGGGLKGLASRCGKVRISLRGCTNRRAMVKLRHGPLPESERQSEVTAAVSAVTRY
jgi:hypothetical protein